VVSDPVAQVRAHPGPHRRIPLPRDLYGDRVNSMGVDLSIAAERARLQAAVDAFPPKSPPDEPGEPVRSPTSRALVLGHVAEASAADIDRAFARAKAAQPAWDALGGAGRAEVLRAMADALEARREPLIALVVREAGKTWPDAVAEVREAADFCRYYALIAERRFAGPETLKGPAGEANTLELHGRGVFVCISPWNFPLSIFTGQVAAALAAGDAVLAKPAEQTPLAAREAVRLYHDAGLDPALLQLLPGRGETVGAALAAHPGLDGLAFTGGTDTAWAINRALAARQGPIVPFIAETGGLNALFVDTTALKEQVIDDVILSAFGTAGQRCSALRLLFLPHETADGIVAGLVGAMQALNIGDPADPATDVGPVIDEDARAKLQAHLQRLRREAKVLHACPAPAGDGVFFGPVLAEIPSAAFLQQEVFGPILHVARYDPERLEAAAAPLAAARYGLTLGVHSRIEAFAERVRRAVPAGNSYVNRSIIGAVVGVQPFGGEGLSGTGPKAGGPDALSRYALERSLSVNLAAQGGDPALLNLGEA
jgi:RHH-type proline utilization regulon transcriptional repressor/proline dehydrogenase/delta 1-pyrroline-5-carboxylate dehydrogenase